MNADKIIHIDTGKLSSGFSAALQLIYDERANPDRVILDLSRVPFVTPTFVIPMLVHSVKRQKVEFVNFKTYHHTICLFEEGLDAGVYEPERLKEKLGTYSNTKNSLRGKY